VDVSARRLEVYLVALDAKVGRDVKRTRRCVVVSPDEMNRHVATVIVAPITARGRPYPTRVPLVFQGQPAQVAVDQVRAVDKARLVRRLGTLTSATGDKVLGVLTEMFGA
jgi:mRNA interferase MazF